MTSEEIKKQFDQLASSLSTKDRNEVDAKLLIAQFTDVIISEMESADISRKELAEKIDTSPSFITQLFKGNKMINFLTLAKIQSTLNIKFKVNVDRVAEDGFWVFKPFKPSYKAQVDLRQIEDKETLTAA